MIWVKRYIMTEVEGTKPRRCSGKTCWDGIKEYKKWFGLSREDAVSEKMEKEKLRGHQANLGSPGTFPLNQCLCVCCSYTRIFWECDKCRCEQASNIAMQRTSWYHSCVVLSTVLWKLWLWHVPVFVPNWSCHWKSVSDPYKCNWCKQFAY